MASSRVVRVKRPRQQQRFEVYLDDEQEKALAARLDELAATGSQREWVVKALISAMNTEKQESS